MKFSSNSLQYLQMVGKLHFDLDLFFGATSQMTILKQKHYILAIQKLNHPIVCEFVDQEDVVFGINKMDCENGFKNYKNGKEKFTEHL